MSFVLKIHGHSCFTTETLGLAGQEVVVEALLQLAVVRGKASSFKFHYLLHVAHHLYTLVTEAN